VPLFDETAFNYKSFRKVRGSRAYIFFCNDLYDGILSEFEVCLSDHESRMKLIRIIGLDGHSPSLFSCSVEGTRDQESVSEGVLDGKGTGGHAFNSGGCLNVGAFVDGLLSEEGEVVGRSNVNSGLGVHGGEGSLVSDGELNEQAGGSHLSNQLRQKHGLGWGLCCSSRL